MSMSISDSLARRTRHASIVTVCIMLALGAALPAPAGAAKAPSAGYKVYFSGSSIDAVTDPIGGVLLAGGGVDVGMSWLLAQGGRRAAGGFGDVVVLRTTGTNDYNKPLMALGANSVTSIVISSRAGAEHSVVKSAIERAEVVFIAGGDQSTYMAVWAGTALQVAVNARVAAGYPIGGISAGLAVLGQYVYSARGASALSSVVLLDPYDVNITLEPALFTVPQLAGVITDSHFVARDRMGRLLTFLARLQADGMASTPIGIGVDEGSGVAIDANGNATVLGTGKTPGKGAYILRPAAALSSTLPTPLTYGPVDTAHVPVGGSFTDLTATPMYTLTVTSGLLGSSTGSVY